MHDGSGGGGGGGGGGGSGGRVPPWVSSRLRPILVSMCRGKVRGRAFEALAAHPVDLEEVVRGRKEPPAERPEPGCSAGGCEQRGWTNSSLNSQFPMQTMPGRGCRNARVTAIVTRSSPHALRAYETSLRNGSRKLYSLRSASTNCTVDSTVIYLQIVDSAVTQLSVRKLWQLKCHGVYELKVA